MKIVHMITRLATGGAEENTLMSCLHQAQKGHEVHLIFGPDNLALERYERFKPSVQFHLVKSFRHKIGLKDDSRCLFDLVRLLKDLSPDIVHTHVSKAGVLGRIAARIAGVPYVIHGVHILPFSHKKFLARFFYITIERLSARLTDLFVHVSRGTRDAFLQNGIGSNKRHAVVYSGMDVSQFKDAKPPENWREILHVSPEQEKPKVLLMMATLEARKRHLSFLEGFAEATKPGDPVRLVFAGNGKDRELIEEKIKTLNLQDRVVLTGHYPRPQELVALADVGVLASVREGLPRVVVQYLAGHCPSVVSELPGIDEIIKDGVNGLIIPPQQAQDTAKAAVRLLNDAPALARLKKGAEESDVSPWSFAVMFEMLDQSYDDLLKAKNHVLGNA